MNSRENRAYVYFSMGYGAYPVIKFPSAAQLDDFKKQLAIKKISKSEMDNEMFETEGTDLVLMYSKENTDRQPTNCEQEVYKILGAYKTKTNGLKEDVAIRDAFKGCFAENLTGASAKDRADSMSKLYSNNRNEVKKSELEAYLRPAEGPGQRAGSDKVLYAFNYLSSEDMAKGLFYPADPKTPKTGLRFLNERDKDEFLRDLIDSMNRSPYYAAERQKYGKRLDRDYLDKLNLFIPAEEYYLDDRGNPTDANGRLLKKGERLVGKPDSEKVRNTIYITRPRGKRDRIDGPDSFREAFAKAAEGWFTPVQCCSKFFNLRDAMGQTLMSLGDGSVNEDVWMADGCCDRMVIFRSNGEIINRDTINDILRNKVIPADLYDPNFVRQPDYAAAMKKLERSLPTYEESTIDSNSPNPPSYTASNLPEHQPMQQDLQNTGEGIFGVFDSPGVGARMRIWGMPEINRQHTTAAATTNQQQVGRRSPSPQREQIPPRPSSADLRKIEESFVDKKLFLTPMNENNAFKDLSVEGLEDFVSLLHHLLKGEEYFISPVVANKMGVDYYELERLVPDAQQRGQKIMAKKRDLIKIYLDEGMEAVKTNPYMAHQESRLERTKSKMEETVELYSKLNKNTRRY